MFKTKRRIIFFLSLGVIGSMAWYFSSNSSQELKPNPVPLSVIKHLAEAHKPIVVFDKNTLFYPVTFDGLRKIALEVDKEVIAELDITDSLKEASKFMSEPSELFEKNPRGKSLFYTYSLSTNPSNWQQEKSLQSFPDSLSMYVNSTFDQYLKITYTIPFEGNQWRNYHRGDGAMFALYFEEKNGTYVPLKARAYMHLQYSEVNYDENSVEMIVGKSKPVFFVTSGSHSTYHRPGLYKNVEGVPLISHSETANNGYAYCDNSHLVFLDAPNNQIEKWVFEGKIYWGGSPNDRIHGQESKLKNIPLLKSLPLGNRSAKMSHDPSAVFDKKNYEPGEILGEEPVIICK